MTDTPNSLTSANNILKIRYSTDISKAVSAINILQKEVSFKLSQTGLGQTYNMPFLGSREQGITYLGTSDSNNSLNPSSPPTVQLASLKGSALAVQSTVTQQIIDATQTGAEAFTPIMDLIMENLIMTGSKQIEVTLLHGGPAASGGGLANVTVSTNVDTTHTVLTVSPATWAGAMWAGEEGKSLDLYHTSTKLNTNAALVITAVSQSNTAPTITVSGNSTDIVAIDTYTSSHTDCYLYSFGAFGNEMVGIREIQSNTGSLFGIDASAYSLWKANLFPVGGALSASALNDAVSTAVNVGGLDEDVKVLVNPYTWSKLMNTALTAQRRFDSSYDPKIIANGTRELEFVSQNGTMEIVAHPYVWQGDAHILPMNQLVRVGSSDLKLLTTQGTEGNGVGNLLFPITDTLNYQIRCYANQAVMIEQPAKTVLCNGITNV